MWCRLLLFLLPILFLNACSGSIASSLFFPIRGVGGANHVHDLRDVDLSSEGPIQLGGEWDLYWSRFLVRGEGEPDATINVPGNWNSVRLPDGNVPGSFGYGTICSRVLTGAEGQYALLVPAANTSYRVFVNGRKAFDGGQPGTTAEDTWPLYKTSWSAVSLRADEPNDVCIQISNFSVRQGGPNKAPTLGTVDQIQSGRTARRFADTALISILGVMALYHLILFVLRWQDRAPLWFSILCFLIAIRIFFVNYHYEDALGVHASFGIAHRMHWITHFGGVIFLWLFFRSFLRRFFHRPVFLSVYAFCVLGILIVLLTPPHIYGLLGIVLMALSLLVILYVLVALIRAIVSDYDAVHAIAAIGFVALSITIVNDIGVAFQWFRSINLISIGFSIFILAQAAMIATRNARARETAEYLTEHLADEVEKKTAELEARQQEIARELKLARMVQENLLPGKEISTDRFHVVAHYSPMTDLAGDIYDVVLREDGELAVMVADVKGHGVPAALISMMIKISFVNRLSEGVEPSNLLAGMNREFARMLSAGDYFTMFYVVLNSAGDAIRFAQAGHVECAVIRPELDEIEWITASGTFIGILDDAEFETLEMPIRRGDRICLFTDGLLEERDTAGEHYDQDRLGESLLRSSLLSLPDARQAILDDLHDFKKGAPYADDITLVLITVR